METKSKHFLTPINFNLPTTKKFWEGLKNRKFLTTKCKICGEVFFPPRSHCPNCLSQELDWVELSGKGKLYSWTEIYVAASEFEPPYVVGIIDLEEGVGRIITKINAKPEELKIGMPMRIIYVDVTEGLTLCCAIPEKS